MWEIVEDKTEIIKAQLNYAVRRPLGSQLFSRPTIPLIRKFKTRSSGPAALHCSGHVVTGSPVFVQVGEQPCKVGGWEPCPEHRWALEEKPAREEAGVSWCYQLPSAEGGVAGRPPRDGGSSQGRSQLLAATHPTHTLRGTWS